MRFVPILLLIVNIAVAQERHLSNDSDTAFWFNWRIGLNSEIGISTIDRSIEEFEFRFWDGYKVIRLWKSKEKLQSEVIFFLREYNENMKSHKGRLYHSSLKLNEKTTIAINNLITDLEILNFPSDNKIEGWDQGLDGITYFVETSSPDNYSFKNYWTPTVYSNIKEARIFQYFVNEVNTLKPIQEGFKKFMDHQPFRRYYAGIESAMIATVIE